MTRINTNIDSQVALHNLQKVNKNLGQTLTRLSTGVRVNSGKDDPAGLIAGEFLRQEISSIESAIQNSNRANAMIGTADAALSQVGNLLDSIRGVLTTSANTGVLSQQELEANQTFIDDAISSIDRIANTTQFAGQKLLDGSMGFSTANLSLADDGIRDVTINRAGEATTSQPITLNVNVTTSFQQASLDVSANVTAMTTGSASTVQVIGNKGSAIIELSGDLTPTDFQNAVNTVSDVTGVWASGSNVYSEDYGDDQFLTLRNVDGNDFLTSSVETTTKGVDAAGTINGYSFEGIGRRAVLKAGNLDMEVLLGKNFTVGSAGTFQITGGGAQFQLGQEIDSVSQIIVGLTSVHSAVLGDSETGHLSSIRSGAKNSILAGKADEAVKVVKSVIGQVSKKRAQLGALQKNTIESNLSSLQVSLENLSAARSQIIDTDFAAETANLTRQQILVQAGTSSLAIANSRPQGVLSLLGGQ